MHSGTLSDMFCFDMEKCVKLTFVPRGARSGSEFWGGALGVTDWGSGWVLVQDLLRNQVFESDARRRHLVPFTRTQGRRETLSEFRLEAGCRHPVRLRSHRTAEQLVSCQDYIQSRNETLCPGLSCRASRPVTRRFACF